MQHRSVFLLILLALTFAQCNRVNVQVNSDPPGALVSNPTGEELGVTPFSQSLSRDDGLEYNYTFKLDGYETVEHSFTLPEQEKRLEVNVEIPGVAIQLGGFQCGQSGPELIGKKITTYGYVYPSLYGTMCSDMACNVDIQPAPGMGSFAQMEMDLTFGAEALQMDALPDNYTTAQFKYRDSDGEQRNMYHRVKITGYLSYLNYGDNKEYHSCTLSSVRVEAP